MKANPTKTLPVLAALLLAFGWSLTSAHAVERAVNDTTVRDAVEDEFFFDHAVSLNTIDVSVKDGVVTLQGEVNNVLAQQRAARIARTVKGVKAVDNRVTVEPDKDRSAEAIASDVNAALQEDPATEAYEVRVQVAEDGAVQLSGTVDSWQERRLTERVVMGVEGVTAVRNNIEINYKTTRPDSEIRAEVAQALHWNTHIDGGLIEVRVEDAAVQLTGAVGSAAERNLAASTAWVSGVKSVDTSELAVQDWAREDRMRAGKYDAKSDQDIRQAIAQTLRRDPRVTSFKVTPYVTNGTVSLRGKVTNLKAKRAAEQIARDTVGVTSVRNRIKVAYDGDVNDSAIAERIRNSLERSVRVDEDNVRVSVKDGQVFLTGTVDTYYDSRNAYDIAAGVTGVENVVNRLEVSDLNNPLIWNPYVDDWYETPDAWYEIPEFYTLTSDAEIKEEIQDELWWSPFVDEGEVNVAVDNGVATLTGKVESRSERRAAVENAYEGGAVRVENRIALAQ